MENAQVCLGIFCWWLALAEYAAAMDASVRPLYVCFSRPVVDHIERLVPTNLVNRPLRCARADMIKSHNQFNSEHQLM
jgi:hypothetical protein